MSQTYTVHPPQANSVGMKFRDRDNIFLRKLLDWLCVTMTSRESVRAGNGRRHQSTRNLNAAINNNTQRTVNVCVNNNGDVVRRPGSERLSGCVRRQIRRGIWPEKSNKARWGKVNGVHIGWSHVTKSTATTRSPFCGYNVNVWS